MLRALQTKALSEKMSTLFDTLVPAPRMATRPVLVEASSSFDDSAHYIRSCNEPPRRRRTRRHRVVTTTATVRSAWY